MPPERDEELYKKTLYNHILSAILLVDEFLGHINLFEEYTVDLKTKSAIERQLSIIGEAVKKIKDIAPDELIEHYREIIGFRNILIHQYADIDDAIVWKVIKEYLGTLKEDIISKLD